MTTETSSTGSVDIAHLKTWEGRTEEVRDSIRPWLAAAFRAVIDLRPGEPKSGDVVPQGLHWCLALPTAPMSAIGEDGHPARGGFLPPVALPRRMWAGGRIKFLEELRVDDAITRMSEVKSVALKQGRTGDLVFVLVEHRVSTERGLAIVEEHDIVYRGLDAPAVGAPAPSAMRDAAPQPSHSRTIEPSPVLLFRYSALTFNGHRIHYDRSYVTDVEHYPGLIVHGPLQATLLMQLAAEMLGGPLGSFSFRAVKPLFDLGPFRLSGRLNRGTADLIVEDEAGDTTMKATAEGRA
jgi:3-methylfumaryl-CoA hydratase